jgi:membrane-associated phospholipid phosphatase
MTMMLITRICFILLVFGLAVSSLTLTARVSRPAPQQPEQQRGPDAKESSSDGEIKKTSPKKKIVNDPLSEYTTSPPRGFKGLGKEFLLDQEQILTSPAKLRFSDTQWLVPLSGITAGLFATDADYSRHLSRNSATTSHYTTLSNAGIGALIGSAGGMWLLGHVKHNEHWSETGFLAGEAALNSLVAVESLKYSLGRERPYQGKGSGSFFQSGTSFPSEHAVAAWSIAGVVAHEYPSPFMKIMAYGVASLVDYSRIRGRQHFPSDVFVGSIMGNLIAQNIYSRNHDPGLGGEAWRSISQVFRGDGSSTPANQGSPYVPLDSWIYPAFDRLIALQYVRSAMVGMRPWTRLECARLLVEAQELATGSNAASSGAQQLLDTLGREFSSETESLGGGNNQQLRVESVYTRFTGISGQPLRDGYYFGQTILNDYGRPFAEGVNNITGFSGWASEGRLVFYIRGEYQHAPSSPALPLAARELIATSAGTPQPLPIPPAGANPSVDQFQVLDAYVAMNLENWQLSFGKQSLAWGPSSDGPIMFGDNAEPITMFRIDRVSPFKLPSLLGLLGPIRTQFFVGQLSGQQFVYGSSTGLVGQWGVSLSPQPFIDGVKLSFKPSPNFEFGVSKTTVVGGPGVPFTFHKFIQSMFNINAVGGGLYGSSGDPGDRRSSVDFSYKVPGMRDWLTLYGDAFTEDEFSPLGYPRKSAYQGGIYLTRIPGLSKLDLRMEGGSTVPPDFPSCNGCFYSNGRFVNGFTNGGNLMGTWIGRAAQGEQAWATYWLSPRNKIEFNYRHRKIDGEFIPQGGTVNDTGVRAEMQLNTTTSLSGWVQYEKWAVPVLAPVPQSNVTASLQLTFFPRKWK